MMTDSAVESPAELSSLRYRLDSYEALIRSFQAAGYEFSLFDPDELPGSEEIVLRHDVDLSVDRALAMAERERELGVQSTYCVLLGAPVYDLTQPRNAQTLREISQLGHDIALHFNTHAYWAETDDPDFDAVAERVSAELDIMSRLAGEKLSTVSFHMPPAWVLDRSFGEFTNTYAPPFFSEIDYVSDSSQKWCSTNPFPDGLAETFQLLVHPGLWHDDHRSMDDIVKDHRHRSYAQVDSYFDPLG